MTKTIDQSVIAAFRRLINSIQNGDKVLLLVGSDPGAEAAVTVYLQGVEETCGSVIDGEYLREIRKLAGEFRKRKTFGPLFPVRTAYPSELAESGKLLRKAVCELNHFRFVTYPNSSAEVAGQQQ